MATGRSRFELRRTAGAPVACLLSALLIAGCGPSESNSAKLDQADTAFQAQNYRVAEIRAKSVLQDTPDSARGWLLLARTSLATGRYADAVYQFDKAVENGQSQDAFALEFSQALLGDGEPQRALDLLAELAPQSASDQAAVAAMRGRAYVGLENKDSALEAFEQSLALEPDNASALVGKAGLAMQDNDVAQARSLVDRALQLQPDDLRANIAMARLDYGQNRCEPAAARLGDALAETGAAMTGAERFELIAFLADCQIRLGRLELARGNIDTLIDAAPNNPYANYLKGLVGMRSGDYSSAKASLQRVLNVDPSNVRTMTLLAAVALSEGDSDTARRYLERVLDRNPQDADALRMRTGLLLQADDAEQALDMLEGAYRSEGNANVRSLLADVLARGDASDPKTIQDVALAANDAPLQLDLAAALARNGKFEQARRVLSAVGSDDDDTRRRVEMTRVAIDMAAGNARDALNSARSLAKSHPDSAAVQQLFARVLAADGQPAEAATVLANAIEMAPDDQALAFDQARVSMQMGDFSAAIEQFNALLDDNPGNTQLTLAMATAYARADRQADMVELLENARQDSPDSTSISAALVNAYLNTGKPGQALPLAERLIETNPGNAALTRLKGIAELASQRSQSGIATLAKAADQAPDDPAYRMDLAQAMLANEMGSEAMAQARQILERAPDYAPAVRLLAVAQQRSGDLKAALATARRLGDAGNSALQARLEGEIYMGAERYRDAAKAYATAYESDPNAATALALFEARRRADIPNAGEVLADAMELGGWNATVALSLAQWQQETGRAAAAEQTYRTILARTPDDPIVLNNLAILYDDAADERALALAERAHSAAPGNAQIADTLGWIQVREGDVDNGVALLRQAADTLSEDPTIRYHLAYGLSERGNAESVAEARQLLRALLDSSPTFAERDAARELLDDLPETDDSEAS